MCNVMRLCSVTAITTVMERNMLLKVFLRNSDVLVIDDPSQSSHSVLYVSELCDMSKLPNNFRYVL